MHCPVCNRENTNTLSICPSCGAMVFDSVREELRDKITPLSKPIPKPSDSEEPLLKMEMVEEISAENIWLREFSAEKPVEKELYETTESPNISTPEPEKTPQESKFIEINPIPKDKMTENKPKQLQGADTLKLVEFRTETAELPEWRLKVQNAARQRLNQRQGNSATATVQSKTLVTDGATALKVDDVQDYPQMDDEQLEEIENPLLLKALKRIEKSRDHFYEEPPAPRKRHLDNPQNLYIAAKENKILPKPEPKAVKARINEPVRPKKAVKNTVTKEKATENALPKPAAISTSFDKRPIIPENIEPEIEETTIREEITVKEEITVQEEISAPEIIKEDAVIRKTEMAIEELVECEDMIVEDSDIEYARLITPDGEVIEETTETEESEYQELEDFAPFALRFNAGLFDLLIGSFLSLFLLAPFMLLGGNWFTISGLLAFVATCSIVMFIYMTTAVGLFGRTFGMRLFSLEVVDIEGESYPTLHQAAVSSCLYLLSLALGGIGFLTLLTNPEKRAVHDLVSGTIVIKEF